MFCATLTSKISGRVIVRSYVPSQILDFRDEKELVLNMIECDHKSIGKTNVVKRWLMNIIKRNRDGEWEEYTLKIV
jgi:hypothetical protein